MGHFMKSDSFKTFCCSYRYKGATWALLLKAADWQDAKERCRQLNLKLDGELVMRIPALVSGNLLPDLACWIHNKLRRDKIERAVNALIKKTDK